PDGALSSAAALTPSATPETIAPQTQPSTPFREEPSGDGGEDLASVFRGGPVRTSRGGGWHIAVFIMPLISYAVLATIVAGLYMWRYKSLEWEVKEGIKQQQHPLEFLPDLEGDSPTGKKPKSTL